MWPLVPRSGRPANGWAPPRDEPAAEGAGLAPLATLELLAQWVHTNLDGLRIGVVVVTLVFFVVAETSWLGLFLVLVVLVAYEVGVTVLARRAAPVA